MGLDNQRKNDSVEIRRLKADFKKAQEDLELLIMYPDLHGPINAPTASMSQLLCLSKI